MTSFIRKARELPAERQMLISELIKLEIERISQKATEKDKEVYEQQLLMSQDDSDPSLMADDRAPVNVLKAFASRALRAYLVEDGRGGGTTFRIDHNLWYYDVDVKDEADNIIYSRRELQFGLLGDIWPEHSFGSSERTRFYTKRAGCKIVVDRERAVKWLNRKRYSVTKTNEERDRELKAKYHELGLEKELLGANAIFQRLKEFGFSRSEVNRIRWPNLRSAGRPPK